MKNRITIILLTMLLLQISTTNSLRAATNSNTNPDSRENGGLKKIKLTTLAFGGTGKCC